MRRRACHVLFVVVLLMAWQVQARVFEFGSESFASYFSGSYGTSWAGQMGFGDSSGAATEFSKGVNALYGGEVGFLLSPSSDFVLRGGVELLTSNAVNGITGEKTSTGEEYMTLSSQTFMYSPSVTAEMAFHTTDVSRAFFEFGAGWATISLDNDYELTSLAVNDYDEVSEDYTEKLQAREILYRFALGYELLAVDNVTALFQFGYRYLKTDALEFKEGTTTIPQGSVSEGDRAKNNGGGNRSLDLSGLYVSAAFRFYIQLF